MPVLVPMVVVTAVVLVVMQLVAPVFEVLTFQQPAVCTSLKILGRVRSWLLITDILTKTIAWFSNLVSCYNDLWGY